MASNESTQTQSPQSNPMCGVMFLLFGNFQPCIDCPLARDDCVLKLLNVFLKHRMKHMENPHEYVPMPFGLSHAPTEKQVQAAYGLLWTVNPE